MAEPKKKLSRTRTHSRRANYTIGATSVIECKNCGKPMRPHFVCSHCGYYNGKSVKNTAPTKRIVLDQETKDETK